MRYPLTAFLTGAMVMVAEIAAARAIAPHFGTSIIVWTNIIGIILVALAVGYWVGGKLSERRPDEHALGLIIVLSGFLLIVPALTTRWIAENLIADLFRIGSGFLVVLIGSFFAVILLFALPIALLGMVSPFLVKLACATPSPRAGKHRVEQAGKHRTLRSPPMNIGGREESGVEEPATDVEERGTAFVGVGSVAGKLYAISTIGSLVGTFLPTLVLLPMLGTRATMLLAAAVLIALGTWLTLRNRAIRLIRSRVLVLVLVLVPAVLVLVLVLVPDRPIPWLLGGTTVAQADSRYQLLRIVDVERLEEDDGERERLLVFNEGLGIQSRAVFDPSAIEGYFPIVAAIPALFFFYSPSGSGELVAGRDARLQSVDDRAAMVPPKLSEENFGGERGRNSSEAASVGQPSGLEAGTRPQPPTQIPNILILGNAGGTIAHLMQRFFPDRELDVTGVELDPVVTAITAAHFPPPPRPYPIIHADSRVFLRSTDARYDVIVADAYTSQLTIPPHLVTREFFELVRSRLAPNGVLVANVNAPSRDSTLLRTIEQTIAAAFPHVVIGKAGETWNYLILASDEPFALPTPYHSPSPLRGEGEQKGERRLAALRELRIPATATAEIQRFLDSADPVVREQRARVFTDDWAPLELFTDLEVFEALRMVEEHE